MPLTTKRGAPAQRHGDGRLTRPHEEEGSAYQLYTITGSGLYTYAIVHPGRAITFGLGSKES